MVGICCFFIVTIPLKLSLSFDSRSIRAGVLIIRCQISSISQANMVSRRGEEGGLNTHNYIDTSNITTQPLLNMEPSRLRGGQRFQAPIQHISSLSDGVVEVAAAAAGLNSDDCIIIVNTRRPA